MFTVRLRLQPRADVNRRRLVPAFGVLLCLFSIGVARPAAGQQTISEALTFLLSGRSLPTDDVVPSLPAELSPADAFAHTLRTDLSVRPLTSPAGGMSFEWNPGLGTMGRPTESFGPFFTSRARATGLRRASLTFGLRQTEFDALHGESLVDGSLVAASSRVAGEAAPFDVQSVTLRIRARTATFTGELGVSERLDFIVAVPFIELVLAGERIDTYRGTPFVQATGVASATGLGDVVVRAKYELFRVGTATLAAGGEVRLPTGNTTNSLGSGERRLAPQVMASIESSRVTVHAEGAYSFGELANALHYGGAVTLAAASRLTLVGELLGRTDFSAPGLATFTVSHPRLVGVSTTLIGRTSETMHRMMAVAGLKWNVAGSWLLNAHVLHPLSTTGFTAQWSPALTLDYFFQQR